MIDRPAPDAGGPIGIVVDDPEQAVTYIAAMPGGLGIDYHVIRTVEDVPERLGGLASFVAEWPPGLAEAVARACGLTP